VHFGNVVASSYYEHVLVDFFATHLIYGRDLSESSDRLRAAVERDACSTSSISPR
jgi:hypothetical protein